VICLCFQGGSCESLPAGAGSGRVAGSVPGLLDVLSLSEDEAWSCSPTVPHLVSTCCRHIMQYGLHTLGIFRVSSSKKRVRQVSKIINTSLTFLIQFLRLFYKLILTLNSEFIK
jgi:hypothetical protein